MGNLLKWSCHLDNIHRAKQIYWLFGLPANTFTVERVSAYEDCVFPQRFARVCVCSGCPCVRCVFAPECKPRSSSVPVLMTAGLAGGHDCMTIGAPAADLIKVSQSHSSWLKTASNTHTHTLSYRTLFQFTAPISMSVSSPPELPSPGSLT